MTRLDDIKELPVPEEWIAAYMDGNLDAATSAVVESNLMDVPEHADFVESLKETWNMPDASLPDFGTSGMDMSEALMIDDMELPSIDTNDLSNGFDVFPDVDFADAADPCPSASSYGGDFVQDNMVGFGAFDEDNDIFSQGTDIFSGDNLSLDTDTPDGMDDLPDDLS